MFRFVTEHNRRMLRFEGRKQALRIADFAKKYHVSEQAIRNRIRRAGYSLDDLRQPGNNQFTNEGEQIVKGLFEKEPAAPAKGSAKGKDGSQDGKGSGNALALIRAERDELKIRTATAETLAEERQKTIVFLQEQIREKDATISKLAAAAAVKAALPEPAQDPAGDDHRRGLFAWIRRKGKRG